LGGHQGVELYNRPRPATFVAPVGISLKPDAKPSRRRRTADVRHKMVPYVARIATTIKRSLTPRTIRPAPIISLIQTQAKWIPSSETWADSLPASRFVPGGSRVFAHSFHFEPPGSNTLGAKAHMIAGLLQDVFFCTQVGLNANLPGGHGLTTHELHLMHAAHYCN
jgi:hypothetical protein